MVINVPDAAVLSVAGIVGSALVWMIRTLAKTYTDYVTRSDTREARILELVEKTASDQDPNRLLAKLVKSVAGKDSKFFTCDICGQWEGPIDAKPRDLDMCTCSTPPAVTTAPKSSPQMKEGK